MNCGISRDKPIFEFPADAAMLENLHSMFRSSKSRLTKGYDSMGYFFLAMSRIIKEHSKGQVRDDENYYIDMALEYMEAYYQDSITVTDIAKYIGFDRTYFYRMFVKKKNMSPSAYINELRLKKAISLMELGGISLNEIAVITGFYDYSHFSKAFTKKYSIAPKEYKNRLMKKEVK